MGAILLPSLPGWIEKLIVQAIKSYLPAEVVAAAWQEMLVSLGNWAKALAADTANQVDDMIANAIAELALGNCTPDTAVLCDFIERGEVAVVAFLRTQAQRSDTKIDDAMVDIVAAALGVPKA